MKKSYLILALMSVILLLAVPSFAGTSTSKQLSITVDPAPYKPPVITTDSLPKAQATVAYSATLTATDGIAPYTWSITAGSLPQGLTLNAATGTISGTPTTQGVYDFTVTVTDSQGNSAQAGATIKQ